DTCIRKNRDTGADGCASLDHRALHLPIGFSLQISIWSRGTRITVVDEGHSMADKNVVFNHYAFTDKSVTGDFAALADAGIFLNFHERADLRFITDLAAIEIDEF